jgi:tetratricopeptide (TPR) repeat protein
MKLLSSRGAGGLIPVLVLAGALAVLAGCRAHQRAAAASPAPQRLEEANRLGKRALAAYKAGNRDRALELFKESLALSQELQWVWHDVGVLLIEREEYVDAKIAFERAAELDPTDPRPLGHIGLIYSTTSWEQKALDYYLQALDRDPNWVPALRGSIRAVKMLNIADEAALDRVRTAIAIDRDPEWLPLYERELTRIDGVLTDKQTRR